MWFVKFGCLWSLFLFNECLWNNTIKSHKLIYFILFIVMKFTKIYNPKTYSWYSFIHFVGIIILVCELLTGQWNVMCKNLPIKISNYFSWFIIEIIIKICKMKFSKSMPTRLLHVHNSCIFYHFFVSNKSIHRGSKRMPTKDHIPNMISPYE